MSVTAAAYCGSCGAPLSDGADCPALTPTVNEWLAARVLDLERELAAERATHDGLVERLSRTIDDLRARATP